MTAVVKGGVNKKKEGEVKEAVKTEVAKVEKKGDTIQTPEQPTTDVKAELPLTKKPILKKIPMRNSKETVTLIVGSLLVVLAGVATGWFVSGGASASKSTSTPGIEVSTEEDQKEAGISDEETFRDTAEGVLVEGGIDGEGTYHLERNLGPEKNVALTSTVIDLESFKDKKVQVWGETISAQKAGWLMDVGKIKVIE